MPNANAIPTVVEDAARPAPSARPSPPAPRRIGLGLALAGGFAVLAWLLASAAVPCGFARTFHAPCPGCGSTRAMLALAHGDLAGLVRFNPLAPVMSALVLAFAVDVVWRVTTTGSLAQVGSGRVGFLVTRGIFVVAALEVTLWLLRFAVGIFGGPVPV